MHESSLGKQLVSAALERATAAGAASVSSVKARVAESERLDPEAIRFHFTAHARGTIAEGAQLALEVCWLEAHCDECGSGYRPEHHLLICPECGSGSGTLLGTPGVSLSEITVS